MFYRLDGEGEGFDKWAIEVGNESLHIGACPKYGLKHPFIWKKREGEKGNLIIDLPSSNIGDFIMMWGAWIITDKAAQLFKEAGFTGYELRPVRVNRVKRMKKGVSIPNLWELVITGWGGIIPPESGMKRIYECETCSYWEYSPPTNPSALIAPSQWDGSDFFMVFPLVQFIFVTEKVKQFIEENGLSGCKFIEPKDIEPSGSVIGSSRRTLPSCMPQNRAKEIGEPLGLYWEPPEKGTPEYKAMREALFKVYRETYTPKGGCNIVYFEDEDGYIPIDEDDYERYKKEPGVKIFKDGSLVELKFD
ncbi:MAG: hypothetical protein AAB267_06400 [Candidatus Desantisbacteria bacterium]